MKIIIGDKIRELRRRDGRTQEDLARALSVTSQAVSRWEADGGCPDLELLPIIANYFGVSIDTLFGFSPERNRKIEELLARIDAFHIKARSDDGWVDECLGMLREGLAQFPQEERLLIKLADTLSEAGWRRHKEWVTYDEAGFIRHDYDRHRQNAYWNEAVKLCETLTASAKDREIATQAAELLVLLYKNFGEFEKAASYAQRMPELENSREILLAKASDGKEAAGTIGSALLKLADLFAHELVCGLMARLEHYRSDLPVEKLKGAISLFHLVCDDGNFGAYHGTLIQLYLYLSRVQWERGYHDDAFDSLYQALAHAKALEAFLDGSDHTLTAPLVSFVTCQGGAPTKIAETLPDDWPFWYTPDCSQIEKEIKADPRWAQWAAQAKA